jgi:hypothetical protein
MGVQHLAQDSTVAAARPSRWRIIGWWVWPLMVAVAIAASVRLQRWG